MIADPRAVLEGAVRMEFSIPFDHEDCALVSTHMVRFRQHQGYRASRSLNKLATLCGGGNIRRMVHRPFFSYLLYSLNALSSDTVVYILLSDLLLV